ncbi:hypothetical protein [[Eubacterium] cellulosolvens]
MVVDMKKLPPGAGWLIGGIVGIAFMVLFLFFEPDLLVPIGVVVGSTCALAIGFALEQQKKPLTAEQEKRVKWLITLLLVLLSIGASLGLFMWLRYL